MDARNFLIISPFSPLNVTLQIRKKWSSAGPDMKVGDPVLLAEDNQAQLQ